ncbi:MAG: energy transducer TonB [Candidatus Methylacidiphilales bacterium]|nr:energy transducer TonB [Candidatus Methylacidiphilales bacterium]
MARIKSKTTIRIGPPTPVFREESGSGGGGGIAEAWIARIPPETRMLLPFLALTLVAHIAAFYFIQITYPPTQRTIPVRTEVMLLNESTLSERERASLEFWTEMNDPSRMIVPSGPLLARGDLAIRWNGREGFPSAPPGDSGLGGQGRQTKVSDVLPAVTPAPAGKNNFAIGMLPLFSEGWPALHVRVSQGMTPPRQEFQYPVPRETAESVAAKTSFLVLDAEGEARLIAGSIPPLPSPPYDALAALGTTVLSLGIDESGRVRHLFVSESCGRRTIDDLATAALRRARFTAAATPGLVWTRCQVFWRFAPQPGKEEKASPSGSRPGRGPVSGSGADAT